MKHPLQQFEFCPQCGSGQFTEHDALSKKCSECGFTYYLNSASAVVAVIENSKGELLVVRRANDPAQGTLDLPGGFVDITESAEEAVRREVKEETGLSVQSLRYMFSIPNVYTYSGFDVHTTDLFFVCNVSDTDSLIANDDISDSFFSAYDQINPSDFGLASIRTGVERILREKENAQVGR